MLEAEPQPGVRGALGTLLRIAWGARLVAVAAAPLVTPLSLLPLVPHLLLQCYAVAQVRRNSSLCTAPLLVHPRTKALFSRFHSIMNGLAQLVPGGQAAVRAWGVLGGTRLLHAVAFVCRAVRCMQLHLAI